jgi:hypothetical protein
MKRLPFVAFVVSLFLLLPFGDAQAGAYDGQWNGVATVTSGRCKPAVITLTVEDNAVVGQARFERDTRNIHGTVIADGTFGATIGFDQLTGNFAEDIFEGTFKRFDCTYRMMLKRTG